MVLGKLPYNLDIVGQGPIALAVGAGGGCLDILPSSVGWLVVLGLTAL